MSPLCADARSFSPNGTEIVTVPLLHESSEVVGFGQGASAGATNTDDDDTHTGRRTEIEQPRDDDRSPHHHLTEPG
jgi:hypothetical protein